MIFSHNGAFRFIRAVLAKSPRSCIKTSCCLLSQNHLKALEPETVDLLQTKHYIKQQEGEKRFELDTLSLEFINNVKSEWWRTFVKAADDVEGVELETKYERSDDCILEDHVIPTIAKSNKSKTDHPCSVALNVVSPRGKFDGLHLYAPVNKSELELSVESLLSDQVKFLRKYLRKPAKLILITNSEDSKTNCYNDVVVYKHGDSQFEVLNSKLLDNPQLVQNEQWTNISKNYSKDVAVLKVKYNIHSLIFALYADAYHNIRFPNYETTLFCLHPYLAPVKVAVAVDGTKTKQLKEVAQHLCAKVRQLNMTCWDISENPMQFTELDLTGVMYCLIVTDETLENGRMLMRNRDTSIKMELHFTQVLEKLFLYLHPR